jgi:hypothetical protein
MNLDNALVEKQPVSLGRLAWVVPLTTAVLEANECNQ